jgi:arylsulfatase A-like enzyme
VNETPFNILFIMADQHRADCLGVAGHPVVQTPHLDQLAYEGVRFSAAYADCPICIPARCSLISGLYASTYGKPRFFSHESFPIDRDKTMMAHLTRAGYQTQAVGKMHFYPERSCYGFENMVLDLDYADWLREETEYRMGAFTGNGLGLNEFWPTLSPVPAHLTSTAWTVDQSIRFLNRRDPDRPFFLWTSFFHPHPPIDPPEPYYSMYDDAPIPEPAIGDWANDPPYPQRDHREANKYDLIPPRVIRKIRSCYYGLITEIDHQLGRLFGTMKQLDLLDNTLIVFTSDHGEHLGDHRDFGKVTLYDTAARVPFILRWPRGYCGERQGVVCDAPIGLVDIMPTLVEFGGGGQPEGIDGQSLLPLAHGETPPWRPYITGEVDVAEGLFSLTDGQEKYLWYRWGGREQLFDLRADPGECRDLALDPSMAEQLGTWRERLIAWLAERDHPGTDGSQLLSVQRPYPPESMVRSKNPHGWSYNRPFS